LCNATTKSDQMSFYGCALCLAISSPFGQLILVWRLNDLQGTTLQKKRWKSSRKWRDSG